MEKHLLQLAASLTNETVARGTTDVSEPELRGIPKFILAAKESANQICWCTAVGRR